MIGNIKEWKGQEVVLKAVNLLKTTFPEIKCLFIGDTSPEDKYYEARLQAIIQSDNLDNHIIFTGYQRNIANIVNALEVVIHASISPEPFGRVLIEAMALQKPLIGSNDGAVPEIIEDGVTGYVFEPGNHLQLASYIERLLNDPKLQNDMGLAGIERLNKHFHIRSNINATEKIYQSLLE